MASRNRPILSYDNNPSIIWNLVNGIKNYKISLYNKLGNELIWDIELNEEDYMTVEYPEGSGVYFGKISYPEPSDQYSLLQVNQVYLLIGEAVNGDHSLDSENEIILLEESTTKAFEELKFEISKSDLNSPLIQKLTLVLESVLVPPESAFSLLPPWYPKLTCASIFFS